MAGEPRARDLTLTSDVDILSMQKMCWLWNGEEEQVMKTEGTMCQLCIYLAPRNTHDARGR